MSEWKEYRLGDVVIFNPIEHIKKSEIYTKVSMEDLLPFTKSVNRITKDYYNGGMKFRNGDTIVARITPCLENGKTAYIDILDEDEIGFGSTEFIVLREKESISDKKFIYYFSINDEFRNIAIQSMTGSSGRQRVQTDELKRYEFLLPPLPEQRAIAGVLSSLDDKIDLLRRQNRTLEALAETLFRQWFVERRPEPVEGEADEGWKKGKLGEEMNIIMGQSPPGESYNENSDGMMFFQGRAEFDFRFPNTRLFCTQPKRYAKTYDTLVSVRAPVGDINMAFEDCCIGRGLAAIRHKQGYISYTYYRMKSLKDEYETFEQQGTVFGSIGKDEFNGIDILIPPDLLIEKFEKLAYPFDEKIYINSQQIRSLEKMRDELLPKLMSGEVRVRVDE